MNAEVTPLDTNNESEESSNEETPEVNAELEARAKEMGWSPRDQWRGDAAKWIPADKFIERGEQILPIVRSENHRLREQLRQNDSKLNELQEQLKAITEFNETVSKERLKARRAEIASEIRQAREDGNVERELELNDELSEANEQLRAPAVKPPAKPASDDATKTPEFQAFLQQNPWFEKDERRTDYAMAVATRLRRSGVQGAELLNQVSSEVNAVFGTNNRRQNPSRVEGASVEGSSPSVTGGKGYAELPADARAICDRQEHRFVGQGKLFKTQKEWRAHFCRQYW